MSIGLDVTSASVMGKQLASIFKLGGFIALRDKVYCVQEADFTGRSRSRSITIYLIPETMVDDFKNREAVFLPQVSIDIGDGGNCSPQSKGMLEFGERSFIFDLSEIRVLERPGVLYKNDAGILENLFIGTSVRMRGSVNRRIIRGYYWERNNGITVFLKFNQQGCPSLTHNSCPLEDLSPLSRRGRPRLVSHEDQSPQKTTISQPCLVIGPRKTLVSIPEIFRLGKSIFLPGGESYFVNDLDAGTAQHRYAVLRPHQESIDAEMKKITIDLGSESNLEPSAPLRIIRSRSHIEEHPLSEFQPGKEERLLPADIAALLDEQLGIGTVVDCFFPNKKRFHGRLIRQTLKPPAAVVRIRRHGQDHIIDVAEVLVRGRGYAAYAAIVARGRMNIA